MNNIYIIRSASIFFWLEVVEICEKIKICGFFSWPDHEQSLGGLNENI